MNNKDTPSPPAPRRRLSAARLLRWGTVAAVLLALAAMALWPKALRVDTATVARGDIALTLEAEGRTRLRERYTLTAPVAAIARRLGLQPGDPVRAGQVLVTLDPVAAPTLDARHRAEASAQAAAAQAQLQATQSEARSAQAAAQLALAEWQRLRPLAEQGMVSAEALQRAATARERAELEASSAGFREATARHQLDAARAALRPGGPDGTPMRSGLTLTSPVDGVLLRRHFESARPVQAGDPLLELGDPSALEVEVDVLSADAVRLSRGMPVDLLRWGGAPALSGEVARIEPGAFTKTSALGVEEQRVWVIVRLLSPRAQWERLGEAFRVNARFVLATARDVVHVPASAVFRHGEGWAVFRVDGRRARRVAVTPGLNAGDRIEVRSGLSAGDAVVLHPPRELSDGSRVVVP